MGVVGDGEDGEVEDVDVDADEQRSNPYTRLFDKVRSCSQFRPSAADIVILRSWSRCRKFVLRGKVKMNIEI